MLVVSELARPGGLAALTGGPAWWLAEKPPGDLLATRERTKGISLKMQGFAQRFAGNIDKYPTLLCACVCVG